MPFSYLLRWWRWGIERPCWACSRSCGPWLSAVRYPRQKAPVCWTRELTSDVRTAREVVRLQPDKTRVKSPLRLNMSLITLYKTLRVVKSIYETLRAKSPFSVTFASPLKKLFARYCAALTSLTRNPSQVRPTLHLASSNQNHTFTGALRSHLPRIVSTLYSSAHPATLTMPRLYPCLYSHPLSRRVFIRPLLPKIEPQAALSVLVR